MVLTRLGVTTSAGSFLERVLLFRGIVVTTNLFMRWIVMLACGHRYTLCTLALLITNTKVEICKIYCETCRNAN